MNTTKAMSGATKRLPRSYPLRGGNVARKRASPSGSSALHLAGGERISRREAAARDRDHRGRRGADRDVAGPVVHAERPVVDVGGDRPDALDLEPVAVVAPARRARVEQQPQQETDALERHHVALLELGHQVHAEAPEREQHRLELAPVLAELVDVGGGRRGEPAARDEAGGLQVAQPRGQQVRGEPGQPGLQVGVALRAGDQLAHDQQRPALADQVERAGERADLVVGAARRPIQGDLQYDSDRSSGSPG